MTQTVTLPFWAFGLILLFAAVTFASHFLFPSVRWFFRKRAERVIARLNEKLARPIEPFKLARRYDMINRLVYDPEVNKAIVAHAKSNRVPENVAFEKARFYAREIVPGFSATAYFMVGLRLARWLSRAFYRVRLGSFDREALEKIDPEATVIFVMNHRSNMDYVLVTHLVSRASTLSYAVGEWARVWPLSGVIRMMGAYFIRGGRDVIFVPVGLNYDQVLEDRFLIAAGQRGQRRFRPSAWTVIRSVSNYLWLRLRGRFKGFGTASVGFGTPLELASFEANGAEDLTKAVAQELMARIEKVVPVLAAPLVARALVVGGVRTEAEIEAYVERAIEDLKSRQMPLPRRTGKDMISDTLDRFALRKLIDRSGDTVTLAGDGQQVLDYYAATIAHHFTKAGNLEAP
ncbi:MAG: 1-acyl-sn-glycerol-3-phosphate acyltransferase [Loktanella sp.]|nr:1-acyl-sn-glycerol-3-phosphate acyltransferase [Loktanella sp.]